MNRTLFIALAVIAVLAVIYYVSQRKKTNGASADPAALYPKCCIAHDSLGNCTKWVWCSSSSPMSVTTSPNGTIFTHINNIPIPINVPTPTPAGAK